MQNSPKQLSVFMKIQMRLKQISLKLDAKATGTVCRKLK